MDATWTLAVSCFKIVYTHMNPNSRIPCTVLWINVADSVCWYSRGFNVVGVYVYVLAITISKDYTIPGNSICFRCRGSVLLSGIIIVTCYIWNITWGDRCGIMFYIRCYVTCYMGSEIRCCNGKVISDGIYLTVQGVTYLFNFINL